MNLVAAKAAIPKNFKNVSSSKPDTFKLKKAMPTVPCIIGPITLVIGSNSLFKFDANLAASFPKRFIPIKM